MATLQKYEIIGVVHNGPVISLKMVLKFNCGLFRAEGICILVIKKENIFCVIHPGEKIDFFAECKMRRDPGRGGHSCAVRNSPSKLIGILDVPRTHIECRAYKIVFIVL